MKKYLFVLMTAWLGTGCFSDIDDLPYNLLDDPNTALLEIQSHTFTDGVLRFNFLSRYGELSQIQKDRILRLVIFRNGEIRGSFTDFTRKTFVDQNLPAGNYRLCYVIKFETKDGEYSRASAEYCVDL